MFDAVADLPGSDPSLRMDDALARALLMRSETGLIALDRAHRVALSNGAARGLLGLAAAPAVAPLPLLLRGGTMFAESSIENLKAWLEAGATTPLTVPLDSGARLCFAASPGPDGHTLLALKPSSGAAVQRDALTGLSDRVSFQDRLSAAIATAGGRPALLLVDLVRFKSVNDRLGHPVGDALLRLVAKRLTAALRGADVISRLSGDQFAVVMKRPHDPESVGRRLVNLLSRPYLIEGTTVSIGASVGIALSPEHGTDPATLVDAADVALHAANNGGRGSARLFDAADRPMPASQVGGVMAAMTPSVCQSGPLA